MKRVAATVALLLVGVVILSFAPRVWAGEVPLGIIYVRDGGTANNARNFALDAGPDGGPIYLAAGFRISNPDKVSIQCDQDCHVGTGLTGCDAGKCLRLGAGQLLPTSIGSAPVNQTYQYNSSTQWTVDGGFITTTYSGGMVAVSPADGGANCDCHVFERNGLE